ncbi:MAG: EamA family transporter [Rikenellaceae bacterium]
MKINKTLFAHLAILLTNVTFGLNFSFAKNLMPHYMSGITLALTRVVAGMALVGGLTLIFKRQRVEKRDFFKLFLIGAVGLGVTQALFMEGLSRTSPVDAAIITTFVPILVVVISVLFYAEKFTLPKVIGLVLGTTGALLVIIKSGGTADSSGDMFFGNILMVCCTVTYSLYYIWLTPLMRKYNPLVVLSWIFTFGSLFLVPFAGRELIHTDFSSFNATATTSLLFVIFCSTFIGYSSMAYSLTRLSPTTASIYSYCKPVVAMIAAVYTGQDKITVTSIIAILLVFAGVIFITRVKSLTFSKNSLNK